MQLTTPIGAARILRIKPAELTRYPELRTTISRVGDEVSTYYDRDQVLALAGKLGIEVKKRHARAPSRGPDPATRAAIREIVKQEVREAMAPALEALRQEFTEALAWLAERRS